MIMKTKFKIIKSPKGFTLIEVLVALLVMSIGLLGLAALQATSLKTNHGAYNRGQAIFLAYDIMDRMRANQTQALAGAYNRDLDDLAPAPAVAPLSAADLSSWYANLQQALPGAADAQITCPLAGVGAANTICQVVIQWDENRIGGSTQSQVSDFDNDVTTTEFVFNSEL